MSFNKSPKKFYIGIDLGTTYSSISYYDAGKNESELIQFVNSYAIPSWITLSDYANSGADVGDVAKNDIEEDCVAYDVKRIIGRKYSEVEQTEKAKTLRICKSGLVANHCSQIGETYKQIQGVTA